MIGDYYLGHSYEDWCTLKDSMAAAGFTSSHAPAELAAFLDNQDASIMQHKAAALEAEAKLARITKILNLGASPCK